MHPKTTFIISANSMNQYDPVFLLSPKQAIKELNVLTSVSFYDLALFFNLFSGIGQISYVFVLSFKLKDFFIILFSFL